MRTCSVRRKQTQWKTQAKATGCAANTCKLSAFQRTLYDKIVPASKKMHRCTKKSIMQKMFRAANTADHKPLRAGCPSPRSVFFGATLLQQSLRHTGSPRVIWFLPKRLHPSRARYLYPTSSFGWTCPSAVSRVPQLQKMVGGAAPDARPPVG